MMKKPHVSNIAGLVFLALPMIAPVPTWANDCQQANKLYNRSLRGDTAQQSRLLTKAVRLCPTHVHALTQLAKLKEEAENWSDAQWLYHRAIRTNPNFAPAYAGLGDVLMKQKDYQGAAEAFQNFLSVQKKIGDPTFQGYIQHYIERFKQALENLARRVVSAIKIYANLAPNHSYGSPRRIDIPMQFATDSDKVTEQMLPQCREIAKAINGVFAKDEVSRIRIEGHTDGVGSASNNKALSLRRANSVKAVLVNEFQVPADRLKVIGWGEEKPIDTNQTELGRFKNRRITLVGIDR